MITPADIEELGSSLGVDGVKVSEHGWRFAWTPDEYLDILILDGRFVFSAYTTRKQARHIAGAFGQWGVDRGIETYFLTYYGDEAAEAFSRIGFMPAGGHEMVTTPQRMLDYWNWKFHDGPEPTWHQAFPTRGGSQQ